MNNVYIVYTFIKELETYIDKFYRIRLYISNHKVKVRLVEICINVSPKF